MSAPLARTADILHRAHKKAMAEERFEVAIGTEMIAERIADDLPDDAATLFLAAYYHGQAERPQ